MTFKQLQDSLRAKKYDSIPNEDLNQYVISGTNLDAVANSLQRMVVKLMSGRFYFNNTPDDILMEYYAVCNAAIAEAFKVYKEDKIDFSYFVWVHMANAMNRYHRLDSTVRPSVVQGERMRASYLHIDAPVEGDVGDVESFDLGYDHDFKVSQIDLELIYDYIKEKHKLFKRRNLYVFAAHLGLLGAGERKNIEIAEDFGITNQRVSQILIDVKEKIQDNEKAMSYLTEFI